MVVATFDVFPLDGETAPLVVVAGPLLIVFDRVLSEYALVVITDLGIILSHIMSYLAPPYPMGLPDFIWVRVIGQLFRARVDLDTIHLSSVKQDGVSHCRLPVIYSFVFHQFLAVRLMNESTPGMRLQLLNYMSEFQISSIST